MNKVNQGLEFNFKMVLLDLDGTLLNDEKKIGSKDIETLKFLKENGICIVIATGRNLFSANKVLDDNLAIDYLIFSAGTGIMNWKTKEIIYKSSFNKKQIKYIEQILKQQDVNFAIQLPIPDNHRYYYHSASYKHPDFELRNNLYKDYCVKLNDSFPLESASQFIAILQNEKEFSKIKTIIENFKVIRATSPLDDKTIWLEVVSKDVSKAEGGKRLCKLLNISEKSTLSIGNDYNDIDLLNWTNESFVVNNSPQFLKDKFTVCTNNNNNPLTQVIAKFKKF